MAFAVILVAALLCAGAALWMLRAYRRADASAKPAPALAAVALVSVAAFGIYLAIGKPDMGDAPFEDRLNALEGRDSTSFNADEALAVLSRRAREAPRDPLPHFYSGQVYLQIGRPQEAARAYDAALRRDPNMTEAMFGLALALVEADQGHVSAQARDLFTRVAPEMDDPRPYMWLARAAAEDGREADVRRYFGEAVKHMAPDHPMRATAERISRGETP